MGRFEITYYEEEIYSNTEEMYLDGGKKCCSWIGLNECNDYKKLMTKYMQEESCMGMMGRWKKPQKVKKPPYSDPDCEKMQSCSYYWELTQFLNQQEKSMEGEFVYIAPSNCKKDDRQDEAALGAEGKITVHRSGNTCGQAMYLKSDQLGFSVGNFDNTHLYGILYEIAKNQKDDKKKKELYAFIADCINDTRTLGGGFLWPMGIWGGKCGRFGYNALRGGGNPFDAEGKYLGKAYSRYYIEDRVDLTLLEIKYLFDWVCKDEQEKEAIWKDYSKKKIIIFKETIKNDKKIIEWLRHFRSFDNYIQFFCFDDFMTDGMPLDIVASELKLSEDGKKVEGKKVPLPEPTEYMPYIPRKDHSIYRWFTPGNERDLEKMKKVLNNVRILAIARSIRMQDVVNQCKNNK